MKQIVLDRGKKSAILRQRMPSTGDSATGTQKALNPVVVRAIEVIGNEAKALRWLGTPVRALNYATPISMLDTSTGKDAVLAVLDNLEHGVF